MPSDPLALSSEALFRYRIVSAVEALQAQGYRRGEAICLVAAVAHQDGRGGTRTVGRRTIERWLAEHGELGIVGLEPAKRTPFEGSLVLSEDFLTFLEQERGADADASVPELIKRAREKGAAHAEEAIDRSTVWRTMQRIGLATARPTSAKPCDTRRYAYSERMQMLLADFKRFRAGPKRARRLAIYLLDDASRFGLDVLVTTDGERVEIVLALLHRALRRYGRFDRLYVDHGPGFIADDLGLVMASLKIPTIFGRVAYPAGHGKIERFNRSAKARVLRCLDGAADVDPDCGALELRLRHDLEHVYNQTPHEGLEDATPFERWTAGRALRPIDDASLVTAFTVLLERRVSADHIVSVDGTFYELPCGYARQHVTLHRRLLENGALYLWHRDRLVRLHPVDLAANARAHRASGRPSSVEEESAAPAKSASALAYERALGPITAPDGGFAHHDPEDDHS